MKKYLPLMPVMVTATVVAIGLLLCEKPAMAQTPVNPLLPTKKTKEISLSGDLIFNPDSAQDLNIGYGYFLSNKIEVGGNFNYLNPSAGESSYTVSGFADYHFPTASPLLPYVGVSIGYNDPGGHTDTSTVYGGQAGVKYFLNQNVSANAQLVYRASDAKGVEDDFRLNFGLSIYLR